MPKTKPKQEEQKSFRPLAGKYEVPYEKLLEMQKRVEFPSPYGEIKI